MAAFPSLIPTGRTYTPGRYPHSRIPTYSGLEVRVRHSSTPTGARLRLSFAAITRSELLEVQAHYGTQLGGFLAFTLSEEVLEGVTTPESLVPSDQQWIYAGPPVVTDVPIENGSPLNRYDLELELESVPPESGLASGARLKAYTIFRPGLVVAPVLLPTVSVSFAGGAYSAQIPGLAITAAGSWSPGQGPATGFAITVAASWAPGAGPEPGEPGASDALFLPPVWDGDTALFLYGGGL